MAVRCVDASFVVAFLVPSQGSDEVLAAWSAYAQTKDEFIAPSFLNAETVSAIRRLASRGLLSDNEGRAIVADFLALDIPTPSPPGLYLHAYELATRYGHSKVYDTCYLALADLLSCELLTLDERLYNSVAGDFPLVRLVSR